MPSIDWFYSTPAGFLSFPVLHITKEQWCNTLIGYTRGQEVQKIKRELKHDKFSVVLFCFFVVVLGAFHMDGIA